MNLFQKFLKSKPISKIFENLKILKIFGIGLDFAKRASHASGCQIGAKMVKKEPF